jgi:uncharacterized protein
VPATRISVRLTPGGGPDRIDGVTDGVLGAHVAARAVEGAANEALLRLLAAELDVPRTRLRLRSGATGRRKVVELDGVVAARLRARWPGLDV